MKIREAMLKRQIINGLARMQRYGAHRVAMQIKREEIQNNKPFENVRIRACIVHKHHLK